MKKAVLACAAVMMMLAAASVFAHGAKEKTQSTSAAKAANITFDWWTHPVRTKETKQAVRLFEQKNPNIHVSMEYDSWSGYWSKLAVQVAGGNEPDVMQMDGSRLLEYVDKGLLKNLSGTGINTKNIPSNVVNLGKVKGKWYALTTAVNAQAMVYNPALFKKAGMTYPTHNYTWSDFANIAEQIHKKTGAYGTVNEIWEEGLLAYYARTKGEQMYASNGKSLAITKKTLTDWFKYWINLQNNGGVAPAQISAENLKRKIQDSLFVQKKAASAWMFIGEGVEYKQDLGGPIKRALLPDWGEASKPYPLHPAMYWTISSKTKYPGASVKLVNFLENNPKVSKIFLNERGVTANSANLKMDERVGGSMVRNQDKFMARVEKVATVAPLSPPGAGKVGSIFSNIAQEVMFKKITPQQGADQFYKRANQYLAQNG